jgi:hypothetical protein
MSINSSSRNILSSDDTTPPITTDTLDPPTPDGDNGWYVSDVTVTLNATDDLSGVMKIQYRIDEGPTWTIPGDYGTFIIDTDKDNISIEYWAVDNACNEETHHIFTIEVDRKDPVMDMTYEIKEGNPIEGWTFIFNVTASDETSQMNYVRFLLNDVEQEVIYGQEPIYSWEWKPGWGLNPVIRGEAYDNAGNMAYKEIKNPKNINIYQSTKSTIGAKKDNKPVNPSIRGDTLYVGGGGTGNYSKIQDAIDNASDGDTVFVYEKSSPYYENIEIDKSITLIGEDKNTTIIDGAKKGIVVDIRANKVVISSFTIQNSSNTYQPSICYGIDINYDNCTIVNNIIKNNWIGIYDDCSFVRKNFTIKDNIIIYNRRGILRFSGDYVSGIITRNIIAHNDADGVNIGNKHGTILITWNVFADNGKKYDDFGLWKHYNDAEIHHNDFHFNNRNAYDGIAGWNDWDDGSEGNYWDDWEENEGYPDTYIIETWFSNIDYHPNETPWMDSFFVGLPEGHYYALINESIDLYADITVNSSSVSWHWDFGNGNSSDEISPTHSYASSGLYNISVTITDNFGRSDTSSKAIAHIGLPPDKPNITGPTIGKVGVPYNYTFVAVDPDGDDIYYYIDWYSTGQITFAYGPYKSGEKAVISHTWPKSGIFKHSENKKDTYMYKISAKTVDIYDFESDWSELMVSINSSKSKSTSSLFRFLDHFPLLHHLLDIWRHILV